MGALVFSASTRLRPLHLRITGIAVKSPTSLLAEYVLQRLRNPASRYLSFRNLFDCPPAKGHLLIST